MKNTSRFRAKKTIKEVISYASCFFTVLFFCHIAYAQNTQKVSRKTITLGAQNQKSTYGGFVDLATGGVYSLRDVDAHQRAIDLIYAYGKTTKLVLMLPSSTGLKYFGKAYRAQVYDKWTHKNRGTLIALENNKANRKIFKKIKTNQQLEDIYNKAVQTVSTREGYNKTEHGPAARLNRLNIGDFVLLKSRDRNIFAMGRIVNHEEGYQGSVTIDFKITGQ